MLKRLGQLAGLSFWVGLSKDKQEWTADDITHFDTFVTSILCQSVEKKLRHRIADRMSEALKKVGSVEGQLAVARMDELEDILLEWKNLREDLQKK